MIVMGSMFWWFEMPNTVNCFACRIQIGLNGLSSTPASPTSTPAPTPTTGTTGTTTPPTLPTVIGVLSVVGDVVVSLFPYHFSLFMFNDDR